LNLEPSVGELAQRCARGQLSSRTLVRNSLDAIEAQNGKLHAFAEVFAEAAMRRAEELDQYAAETGKVGPLHGVPIAVKDLADLDGRAPGFGSKCYAAKVPTRTALAIQHLIDAGAIIVGMTHMVEFALGGWGTNEATGTPWNPVDRHVHRAPGGSSSGSAVAVAAGLVPAAIGSDTGGSIRIPASLCGIVGFKPTFGRIPLDGIAALGPTFDTLGPITRNVADARLLYRVMAGLPVAERQARRPLRVGAPERDQLEPCDPDIFENYRRSLDRVRLEGHTLVPMAFPEALTEYQALCGSIVAYEAYRQHRAVVEDPATPLDPHVRQRVLAGRDIDSKRYAALQAQRRTSVADFKAAFANFDAIALPGTPLPAIPVAEIDETTIPMSRYTRAANLLDLCAISLPNGSTAAGLPTGLQLVMIGNGDAALLDFAEQIAATIAAA
jgi:aspartyl-tRNA(Asn)/glutamyl-tRNA(Gln) amidotransferase subunit A